MAASPKKGEGVLNEAEIEFLGQSARWQAEINYAAALSVTPPAATPGHLAELEKQKLDTLEQLDLLQSAAFFAWANRLMLTLGEPWLP
ncbi:hypothetical protein GQ627_0ndm00256 (plasmid) [Klebsiella pneumoniae]|nr:hypothetical protein GQ627_0ndm00256 [Klebsiella pneumoniae]